tara:strand:+ start:985 stop:1188 length:204 start_codon:yes stop_codon:yes gene_type:complete
MNNVWKEKELLEKHEVEDDKFYIKLLGPSYRGKGRPRNSDYRYEDVSNLTPFMGEDVFLRGDKIKLK